MINFLHDHQLVGAFSTIFLIFAIGFFAQRFRPLGNQSLRELSGLIVDILLPIYLFFTTATAATKESLQITPMLVLAGALVTLLNFALATGGLRLFRVNQEQKLAYRFSSLLSNTAFVGFPVCAMLFGSIGVMYAVMYDFGMMLVVLTLGIWDLSGREHTNVRAILLNPQSWGVLLGLTWGLVGPEIPQLVVQPFSALGDSILPIALLIGGAFLGSIKSRGQRQTRLLAGFILTRMVISPLLVLFMANLFGLSGAPASVIILLSAMPVGLIATVFASAYGADVKFTATITLWSTVAAVLIVPCAMFLIM
ncbi:MAG: AEC family transporter [Anaerolineales bacterium]|nr:AEC family transporter [Anaerolineales bacterium]